MRHPDLLTRRVIARVSVDAAADHRSPSELTRSTVSLPIYQVQAGGGHGVPGEEPPEGRLAHNDLLNSLGLTLSSNCRSVTSTSANFLPSLLSRALAGCFTPLKSLKSL